MTRVRRRALLALVALVSAFTFRPVETESGLTVGGYTFVSEVRLTRTVSEFTYRATLANAVGPSPPRRASCRRLSWWTTR
jgi:hypothetical protein